MKRYPVRCPITSYQCIMDGHWKPMIVWYLRRDCLRFSELMNVVPDISTKVLTEQLTELEQDNILKRQSFKEVPPRVVYSLTSYGKTLLPVLDAIRRWGSHHLNKNPFILHKDSEWKKMIKTKK